MKILHISKKYPNVLGGDAVVVENLYRKQSNAGHEVLILTSNCNDTKVASNIYKFGFNSTSADLDVISIKRLASLVLLYFRAHKLISLNRPDIIHTHSVDMAYVVSSIARRYKIPIVHTFHILTFNDSNQSILRRKIELILLRCVRPKVITAPNEHDVSALVRAGMSQAVTVPNGIELDFWKRYPKTKHEIYTYITVGRLELQKGLDFLINASAILKQSKNKFKVIIVGEGSQKKYLENLVIKNNLQNIVYLIGKKTPDQLIELYQNSDSFVLSSLWESAPLTLLEAWAMRLPVVATKVGLLKNESTNRVVCIAETSNATDLAHSMLKVADDVSLSESIASNGLTEVSNNYTWDKIYILLNDIYMKAIKQ